MKYEIKRRCSIYRSNKEEQDDQALHAVEFVEVFHYLTYKTNIFKP